MDSKEVFTFTGGPPPNWLESHSWYAPIRVAPAEKMPLVGLKRLELKMAMCCMKCAEIISEELREVPGVMDVQVDFKLKKVIVIGAPFAADVLKKAKKVDRKAEWWSASSPPPPPSKEEKKEGKKEGKKQGKKQEKGEKKEEEKVEEKEVTKEEKKEEQKVEKEEKKEEQKVEKEEKKDGSDGKGEGKGKGKGKGKDKGEPAAAAAAAPEVSLQQYPPFDYVVNRYPWGDYHPSQAYNPLLPYHPYPHSRQVFYDWPHFRTAEGAEAAFVPPAKSAPYQSVGDLWSIFQPP